MAGTLYLGTSGFAYKEWKGAFYPDDVRDASMLAYYSTRFPSVEINYTFRRFPSETTLTTWLSQTGPEFRFALKANQRITHQLGLADADETVSAFLERVRVLGDRLGPILFQCPPSLRFDRSLIESFLAYLPPMYGYAMEFRHPSWEEAKPIVAAQGAAWCDAETEENPVAEITPGPFAYLRLRKDAYSEDELSAWAARITEVLVDGRDVYCYVKHEAEAAPGRAQRLAELVG